MLQSVLGPGDPFVVDDPHMGEVRRSPGSSVRRRQFDVRVRLAGRVWHLHHRTWLVAAVLRDGEELVRFRARREPFLRRLVATPDPLDAGLAHMLGPGAKGVFSDMFGLPLWPAKRLRGRWEGLP